MRLGPVEFIEQSFESCRRSLDPAAEVIEIPGVLCLVCYTFVFIVFIPRVFGFSFDVRQSCACGPGLCLVKSPFCSCSIIVR